MERLKEYSLIDHPIRLSIIVLGGLIAAAIPTKSYVSYTLLVLIITLAVKRRATFWPIYVIQKINGRHARPYWIPSPSAERVNAQQPFRCSIDSHQRINTYLSFFFDDPIVGIPSSLRLDDIEKLFSQYKKSGLEHIDLVIDTICHNMTGYGTIYHTLFKSNHMIGQQTVTVKLSFTYRWSSLRSAYQTNGLNAPQAQTLRIINTLRSWGYDVSATTPQEQQADNDLLRTAHVGYLPDIVEHLDRALSLQREARIVMRYQKTGWLTVVFYPANPKPGKKHSLLGPQIRARTIDGFFEVTPAIPTASLPGHHIPLSGRGHILGLDSTNNMVLTLNLSTVTPFRLHLDVSDLALQQFVYRAAATHPGRICIHTTRSASWGHDNTDIIHLSHPEHPQENHEAHDIHIFDVGVQPPVNPTECSAIVCGTNDTPDPNALAIIQTDNIITVYQPGCEPHRAALGIDEAEKRYLPFYMQQTSLDVAKEHPNG